MKKIFLSTLICLLAFSFIKAQGTTVAALKPTLDALTPSTDTLNLEAYCGIYKMQENEYVDKVKISLKAGQLVSKSPEDDSEVVFQHAGTDAFFIPEFHLRAIFTKINGLVKGVKVVVEGKELTGEKL